ncbi:MAG: DegT/DnrJ/EryC1/StrS family aminotransferase [Armatimonadetes bacterium]|nr:DegT/DnrJ/EryC1/StrS family aminotransferase [Armatimonadota bacterium]
MKRRNIQMSLPDISKQDIDSVVKVLRSKRLALGPMAEEFERLMCEYVGVKHAIAVSSGTAALHLIVRALGIGPGDEVLVPSFTFIASVNVILYEGATPIFVDIEPETYNLDPDDLEKKITPRTKAIMAVDVFGHPAEWDKINKIAQKYSLLVIDDSCEALGAEYKGKKIGQFGNAAAFAFYPNKQITTGEGGMVVTNDEELAKTIRSLRNQGRTEMGAWLEHEIMGYNYRMDEMSAALGVSQLKRIEELLKNREIVAKNYTEKLSGLDFIRTPIVKPYVKMSWFVYVVTLAEGLDRDLIIARMQEMGIPVRGYFSPAHLQPYIRERFKTYEGMLPITESVAKRTIALPFHGSLSESEIDAVVEALKKAI